MHTSFTLLWSTWSPGMSVWQVWKGKAIVSDLHNIVLEAICIHLCDKYPQARRQTMTGRTEYTSRWRLILSEYNAVRARLLNSHRLLEDTNLTLFTINEKTLVSWFKVTVRRDEIKVLMQGLSLPAPHLCSSVSLPPAQQHPLAPPDPPPQHQYEKPEDRTGYTLFVSIHS